MDKWNLDGVSVDTENNMTLSGDTIIFSGDLPTSDPGVAGQLWLNSNVLTISTGA